MWNTAKKATLKAMREKVEGERYQGQRYLENDTKGIYQGE